MKIGSKTHSIGGKWPCDDSSSMTHPKGRVTLWWFNTYDSYYDSYLQVWSSSPKIGEVTLWWLIIYDSYFCKSPMNMQTVCRPLMNMQMQTKSLGTCLHCFQNLPSSTGNKVFRTKANSYINWKRDLFVILLSQFVDALFNMVILHDTILQILGADTLLDFCPQICGLNVLQVSF